MVECVNLKNTLFCRTKNASSTHPYCALGFVCVHMYAWIGLGRALEREVFPVPMVFVVPVDNRQRHHLYQIRLLLLFQWKWAASHRGEVRKTGFEWANTTLTLLHCRLTNWLINAAVLCQNNQLWHRHQYCQLVNVCFFIQGRHFGMHGIGMLCQIKRNWMQ